MKNFITSGKRKRAVARAVIKPGTGIVKINNKLLEFYQPDIAKLKLQEPLILAENHANKVNITVKVYGGGVMSQAEAARLAIAKALTEFTKDKKLEKTFLEYDRHLLVADVRRREVRKPNHHGKARATRQKSYR
ncbi:30S ribosomal protein S9 [Candidatus Woesearchaeota archaeon]|nr:30S ribosomal protein S9 [Candidatus Woesearchaeota archaeon]|tara:strand:+ start:1569 stop:1970 length:402 start_codon:yes stop_codon:yes gene_type:complete